MPQQQPTTQQTSPLTPELERQARSYYVVQGIVDPVRIAGLLAHTVHPNAIRAAIRRGGWEKARQLLCDDPRYLAERQALDEQVAGCKATVESLGAEAAVLLMEAHTAALRKQIKQVHEAETPRELAAAVRALGPIAANLTAARLAVGLTTEKTETTTTEVAQALHAVATALDRAEGLDAPDAGCAGAPGGPGVDSPRGPEAGGS